MTAAPTPPRVGLVLVSHSVEVAYAVGRMAARLVGLEVRVAAAGGSDDGGFGTSATKIEAALRAADQGAGVLVIGDLGSAILTTLAILADLEEEPGSPVNAQIADAPFVEGTVAAAMTAVTGGTLDEVRAAAEEARRIPKL